MQKTIRPRGLTTLAIINFIFAGLKGSGFFFTLMGVLFASSFAARRGVPINTGEMSAGSLIFLIADIILVSFMAISGIGYLRMKRVTGLLFGNLYASLSFLKVVTNIIFMPELNLDFNLFTMADLVYPLMTIFFLNFVFTDVWRTRHKLFESMENGELPERTTISTQKEKSAPNTVLVFMQSIRQTLRSSQGILFFFFSLVAFMFVAQIVIWICAAPGMGVTQGVHPKEELGNLVIKDSAKYMSVIFYGWLLDEPDPGKENGNTAKAEDTWAYKLANEKPALLAFIYTILMFLVPVMCAFVTFNQIPEDARRKGFRYLLLRTSRESIFFGKLLATLAIVIPIIILTVVTISAYIHFRYGFYPLDQVVGFSLHAIIALILISIPSVALCIAFSTLINFGFASLAASVGLFVAVPIFTRILHELWEPLFLLQYILPGKAGYFLFHPEWWVIILSAIGIMLYAVLFAWCGNYLFKRKSL
ncbi:MAG: hypothetical protein EHM28_07730 [Spirochaetaceae bacterium]|nr:MAG: hypothetical protein EHM28_07730 [Spirochaetaceae bacterium]